MVGVGNWKESVEKGREGNLQTLLLWMVVKIGICQWFYVDGNDIFRWRTALEPTENRRQRHHKKCALLFIRTYSPKRRGWRSLTTKTPFQSPLDFNTAVICTIQLWYVPNLTHFAASICRSHKPLLLISS
ncbi:hypothetical protein MKW98_019279 [Papaver atlanticum]|uniref:Uncharacterized protein n=1 Tax=Papaver atlanticum TaxID=357466 RepID=A0AAD4X791_9MAGN|nr:hypothetical protein MKW98_019279 [Papaver atlanticum]